MMYARKRDANEPAIVAALQAVGASVAKLEGTGVPDLVVSYRGVLTLVEVKDIWQGRKQAGKRNDVDDAHRELTPAQVAWWARWKGKPPVIVRNENEALAAIGAERDP